MNALMTIQIRVLTAQARRELAATEAQVKSMEAATRRAGAATGQMAYGLPALSKWGNQVQWAGRQLQYNFTLPLLLAAGAATKFQLENEQAMVRVRKVYGNAEHGAAELSDEIDALGRAFEALSNKFAVHQSEVIDIAGDWAAAGASGIALARSVNLTLETMILGEMEAAEATQALIAVQAQYGQNTKQLAKTIDVLNMVENETGITMQGLIQGFSRAAGVARSAGVDVEHLAAMLAALVPASGSATNAGNALKTMISRLLAPTKEAAQVLGLMGIQMDDVNWKNLNAAQRLELLAEKYNELGEGVVRNSRALDIHGKATGRMISSQQAIVSTVVASRWQINRWDVLMRDISRKQGYYQKSLRATASQVDNFNQRVKELNAVLESNPQKLKQTWIILQNAMANVIQPMIPYIVWLAQEIAQMAQAFANMNPLMQKSILIALLFLAAIGPIARYIGSVATLFGILSAAAHFFAVKMGLATVAVVTNSGAIEMQRRGLVGLIAGWLRLAALPFTAIAAGMSAVFTTIFFKGGERGFANLRKVWFLGFTKIKAVFLAWRASMAAAWASFWAFSVGGSVAWMSLLGSAIATGFGPIGAAWASFWGALTTVSLVAQLGMATIWQKGLAALAAFQATSLGAMLLRWGAALSSINIFASVWAASNLAIFKAWFLKLQVQILMLPFLFKEAFLAMMIPGVVSGMFARLVAPLVAQWTIFTAWMVTVYAAAQAKIFALNVATQMFFMRIVDGMKAAWALLTTAQVGLWARAQLLMGAISGAFAARFAGASAGLVAIWTALTTRLRNLWFTMYYLIGQAGVAFRAVWATLHGAMLAVTVAFRTATAAVWASMVGLFGRTTAALSALWTGMLTRMWAAFGAFRVAMAMAIIKLPAMFLDAFKALPRLALAAGRSIGPAILRGLKALGPLLKKAFTTPITYAILAAVGAALAIFYHFRDQIAAVWASIVGYFRANASGILEAFQPLVDGFWQVVGALNDAFWALPEGVRDALLAVVEIVRAAALEVYSWFSWMNPWARHSPSLVESVQTGMAAVRAAYASAGNVGGIFKKAAADLRAFKKIANSMGAGEWSEERKDVKKAAPAALPTFDALVGDLKVLNGVLARQEKAVSRQEAVVDRWSKKLEQANNVVDRQQNKLGRLRDRLTDLQDAYAAHEAALDAYASAPIKGMGKMEDAIFANEMAQKKLRLEMLKFEEANGSIDDMRDRLAALHGDIETMQGKVSDLRQSGAGSDVLGPIEDQIAAMEAQARALQKGADAAPLEKMQSELEKLQREGEILDLEKSIKFDPMIREIDKLANAQKELSYDQIINGINREREAMERLQPKIDAATQAIQRQEQAVKQAEKARDGIESRYDRENQKLQNLNERYRETESLIRDIEAALRDMGAASSDALAKAAKKKKGGEEYLTPGAQNFLDAKGGGFPDVGSNAKIGREGSWADQSDLIDKFTEDITGDVADAFESVNIFEPFKRWWHRTWEWLKTNVGPVVGPIIDGIRAGWGKVKDAWGNFKEGFSGGDEGGIFGGLGQRARDAFDSVIAWLKKAWDWGKKIASLFGPDIKRIFEALVEAGKKIWNDLGPELAQFGDVFKTLWKAIKNVGLIALPILLVAFKLIASVISTVLGPVLEVVIDVIENIIQTIRGLLNFVLGIFAGDWKAAWDGLLDVIGGLGGIIGSILEGVVDIALGIIKGLALGIWELIKWAWGLVKGELAKWWDGITKAWANIKAGVANWWKNNIWNPVSNAIKNWWDERLRVWRGWWQAIKDAWANIKDGVSSWWKNNIWNPVSNAIKNWWEERLRVWRGWWQNIKDAWSNIKEGVSSWWKDKIWGPLTNAIKNWWDERLRVWRGWWQDIKDAWSNIKSGDWWREKILDPIKNAITGAWQAIKDWFKEHGDSIVTPIKNVVNSIIGAVNWMIKGLNKIADVLPGISWNIELIPKLAMGGEIPASARRVMGGFKTSGARAIVGEGKANHPEYVIPTDPTYRNRATELYKSLGQKLGVYDPPAFARGGMLPENAGGLGDVISDVVGGAKKLGKGGLDWMDEKLDQLASLPFAPFRAAANAAIDKIDWKYGREATRSVANEVFDWVTAADQVYKDKAGKLMPPQAGSKPVIGGWTHPLAGPYSVGGSIGSYPGHTGLDLPAAVGVAIRSIAAGHVTGSYDIPGSNEYNDTPYDSYGRVVKVLHDNGYSSLYAHMSSRVAREGQKVMAGSLLGYVGMNGKATGPHLHLEIRSGSGSLIEPLAFLRNQGIALGQGGIALARRGGVQATLAESGQDEAVIPLPNNWRTDIIGNGKPGGGGDTIIEINGNLEFPNIKSGDDAEAFIKNLESLA